MKEKRERREYTEEFKYQMVKLYNSGKSRTDIAREYDLTPSALDRWIKRVNKLGQLKRQIIVRLKKTNLSNFVKKTNVYLWKMTF